MQADFFATVDPAPAGQWITIGAGHNVYQPGDRFLVVEEQPGGWLLCWPDGQRPGAREIGTLADRK